MKVPTLLLVLSLAALVAGCAALTPAPPPEQNAQLRLDRGLAALDARSYAEAFDDLAWVYSHCPARQAGNHALVALAAMELDPHNPAARPGVGTELLGRLIRDPGTPDWLRPMAETAFLTALALGAPHPEGEVHTPEDGEVETPADSLEQADPEDHHEAVAAPAGDAEQKRAPRAMPQAAESEEPAFGCGPAVDAAEAIRPLPTLPGPSMAYLLARSEASRDSVAGRADTLQQELDAVRAQLQAARDELERIRKTLKP